MPAKNTLGTRLDTPRRRYRLRHSGAQPQTDNFDGKAFGLKDMGHESDVTNEYFDDSLSLDNILKGLSEDASTPAHQPESYGSSSSVSFTDMEAEAKRYIEELTKGGFDIDNFSDNTVSDSEPVSEIEYDEDGQYNYGEAQYDTGDYDYPQYSEPASSDYGESQSDTEDYDYPQYTEPVSSDSDFGYDDVDESEPEEEYVSKRHKKKLFARKDKKSRKSKAPEAKPQEELPPDYDPDYDVQFTEFGGTEDGYSPAGDYEPPLEPIEPENFPMTFGGYISSIIAGIYLKVFGKSKPTAQTMDDGGEDLGVELPLAQASSYYRNYANTLKSRLKVSLGVWALMCYLSFGLPVPGMLQYLPVAASMCLAMQLTIMLLSLDVVTNALLKVARLKAGADTLAVISCLLTSLDAVMVIGGKGTGHMPLCLLSSASLLGIVFSSFFSAQSLFKLLKVPVKGKKIYSVTGEVGVKDAGITILKSVRPCKGFVHRSEEEAPDETLFAKAAPFILILAALLSLIVAIVRRDFNDFLFIFSAVLAPAVPIGALIVFSLPFLNGTKRISHNGSAIAGWSGVSDIGRSKDLIITDRDLFPDGSVEVENILIYSDVEPEEVLSFAGTMVTASGSSIASCFGKLMEDNNCTMRQVMDFQYMPAGGMKGMIDGHVVLCGGRELMRLMNIRVPYRRLEDAPCVLLAMDGELTGIFIMKYNPLPLVRKALLELMRSNRHPVFAIRDFNITPELIHTLFDIPTDGYDFPPYVERFNISEAKPSEDSKVAAVICREGLAPLTDTADAGRSIYLITRVNLLVTALSSVIGMLTVFLMLSFSGSIGLGFLLVYMLVCAAPVIGLSFFVRD